MNLKRLMLFFCLEVHTQSNPNMPQNFLQKPSRVFRHPRMTSHIPVVPVASGLPAFFISEDILKKP